MKLANKKEEAKEMMGESEGEAGRANRKCRHSDKDMSQ